MVSPSIIAASSIIRAREAVPFFGRLYRANAVTLGLTPWQGSAVEISGEIIYLTTPGLLTDITIDDLIDATGADTGGTPAANTLYYVYVSNGGASPNPTSIRLSATSPTPVDGVYYLGAAGNASRWRFAGWVRTIAGPALVDTNTQRLIVNYYQRRLQALLLNPGYVDNNANTTYALTSATWTRIAAGVGDTGEYISNGEDLIHAIMHSCLSAAPATVVEIGIGDNSNTQPIMSSLHRLSLADVESTCSVMLENPAGYRTLTMLAMTGGLAASFYADRIRNGAASDPRTTLLWAAIPS